MIPVLMAIILILNLTAPSADQSPTTALHARWLHSDEPTRISLLVDDVAQWQPWLSQNYPQLLHEAVPRGGITALRIQGAGTFLGATWPDKAKALVVLGDIDLASWESSVNRLTGHEGPSTRQDPDFIVRALAARLSQSANPAAQFEAQRNQMVSELRNAMSHPDSQIALLERMALENLALDWHQQQAMRLEQLTFDEVQTWLTR